MIVSPFLLIGRQIRLLDTSGPGPMLRVSTANRRWRLRHWASGPHRREQRGRTPAVEDAALDAKQFDHIVITLSRRVPRRSMVGLLPVLALIGRGSTDVAAQGCLEDGEPCGKGIDLACCSGVCAGKKKKSKKGICAAAPVDPDPDQGICTADDDVCTSGSPDCQADGDTSPCKCYVTRDGASFCGKNAVYCHVFASGRGCESDVECERRLAVPGNTAGFPAGQAGDRCVRCSGNCADIGHHGCAQRCPNPATA